MECPGCKYVDGWHAAELKRVEGEHGGFYRHPVQLEREGVGYQRDERVELYGCPKCRAVFLAG